MPRLRVELWIGTNFLAHSHGEESRPRRDYARSVESGQAHATTRPVFVIVNPLCVRERGVAALARALESAGFAPELALTSGRGDATRRAADPRRPSTTPVVVVGGDGTLHEVVAGLAAVTGDGSVLAPLLVIPRGTGNDLAHNAGAPRSMHAAVAALQRGRTRRLDLGRVRMQTSSGTREQRFHNVFGLGFEAMVNRIAGARRRRLPGALHYLPAVVRALPALDPRQLVVRWTQPDGSERRLEGAFPVVTVGNGARCGGSFHLTPEARLDDGQLDLLVVDPLSAWKLLWLLPRAIMGSHRHHPSVHLARCRSLRIEAAAAVAVHCDGEVVEQPVHALEIEIEPRRLQLLV